mmetsp:Transcript_13791/g.57630  ORF Transcript_13791/g.57630 Transcript_13791/m.57630 type:complete len:219 (-) Transcript_13791:1937-2593(-)
MSRCTDMSATSKASAVTESSTVSTAATLTASFSASCRCSSTSAIALPVVVAREVSGSTSLPPPPSAAAMGSQSVLMCPTNASRSISVQLFRVGTMCWCSPPYTRHASVAAIAASAPAGLALPTHLARPRMGPSARVDISVHASSSAVVSVLAMPSASGSVVFVAKASCRKSLSVWRNGRSLRNPSAYAWVGLIPASALRRPRQSMSASSSSSSLALIA